MTFDWNRNVIGRFTNKKIYTNLYDSMHNFKSKIQISKIHVAGQD